MSVVICNSQLGSPYPRAGVEELTLRFLRHTSYLLRSKYYLFIGGSIWKLGVLMSLTSAG